MARRDVKNNIDFTVIKTKIQYTATSAVAGSDISRYAGACFVLDFGAHTTNGLTITLQDSDDNSVWADIADTLLEGRDNDIAFTSASTLENEQTFIGYSGNKKYIGAKITDSGAGDGVVGIYVIKGYPNQTPVNT